MADAEGLVLDVHRLTVAPRDTDPAAAALLHNAHTLGIRAVTGIRTSSLYFLRGRLDAPAREALHDLLVDPLLDIGHWDVPERPQDAHVVEVVLHPGVTDASAEAVLTASALLDVPLDDVATGRRFEVEGDVSAEDVSLLAKRLLANPVVEHWSIDTEVQPHWASGGAATGIETIPMPSDDEGLLRLNTERGMALDLGELHVIRDHFAALGRSPTDVELETLAQTWSEHCAHKSFRADIDIVGDSGDGDVRRSLLGRLRDTTEGLAAPFVVSAFDGNAGIVRFDDVRTLALKCETHNHPSAIEPFGGANTGVGGVIRDIIGAAHRPIACTDILCFGPADTDPATLPEGVLHPLRVESGVVDGVADYGNKIGLPTVAGAVLYDPGYTANPLVFCGCIGEAPVDAPVLDGPHPGDRVVVLGGRTGRDGIRGATFSSATMDATTGEVAGASVQIGDPITEKLVIDALVESMDLLTAITDCGAGGLSSAVGEMAEGVGADVELSGLPVKYPGLAPWELWLSEAQERMVVAVAPSHIAELQARCERHGVELTDLGAFTGDGRLVVRHEGRVALDLDTGFLHDGRPSRRLAAQLPRPDRSTPTDAGPTRHGASDLGGTLLTLLAHPNIASKAAVVHRYDHEILGRTVVRPLVGLDATGPADGVVLAPPGESHGVAVGIGVNPWHGLHDPERMALAAVDEAIRNVVAAGADPDRVALLDNFSWGDPRRPTTFGELVAAVEGCCEASVAYRAPFVSGKDSLNNEYLGADGERHAVPPTLVITAVAHVPDVDSVVTPDLARARNLLVLLGRTLPEFAGSHLDLVLGVHPIPAPHPAPGDSRHSVAFRPPSGQMSPAWRESSAGAGPVPAPDADAPARYRGLHQAIREGLVAACHDCSEGGLAVTVAEMVLGAGGRLGARIETLGHDDPVTAAFSESTGRFVCEVAPDDLDEFVALVGEPATVIGMVIDEPVLALPGTPPLGYRTLATAWNGDA